jgi:hypothetical protein
VGTLYSKQRLPQRPTVEDMYGWRVKLAHATNEAERPYRSDRRPSPVRVRSVLGEMVVLLLAQRLGLRNNLPDKWLPLQSTLTERGDDCLTDSGRYVWDIDIFTPGYSLPDLSYKLRVKNLLQASHT